MQHEDAKKLFADLAEAEQKMRQRLANIDGAHMERKRFAIAVHSHEVADDDIERVETAIAEVYTDEDAFRALRHRDTGIGMRVAVLDSSTGACYSLRDCDAVQQFLQVLLTMLKEETGEE